MKRRWSFLIVCVSLVASLYSSQALALGTVSGYVCRVAYTAQNNVWFGSDGYVTAYLYSGSTCSGSYLGTYRYHSSNAAQVGYNFSQPERRTLYSSLQKAAYNGSLVSLFVSDDNGVFHTTIRAY